MEGRRRRERDKDTEKGKINANNCGNHDRRIKVTGWNCGPFCSSLQDSLVLSLFIFFHRI